MNFNDLKKANTLRKQLLDAAMAQATLPSRASTIKLAEDEPFTMVLVIQTEDGAHSVPIPLSGVGEYYDRMSGYLRDRQQGIRDELSALGVNVDDDAVAAIVFERIHGEQKDDSLLEQLGVVVDTGSRH